MLTALAAQQGLNVTGYTVEFDATYGLNETNYAARVATSIGIKHRTVKLSAAGALRHLDSMLNGSRPRAAPAAITQAHLIERISNDGHKCVLSGLGADECFGGYHKALEHLASTSHHVARYGDDLSRFYSLPLSRLLRLRDALFFGIAEFYSLEELRSIAVDPARVSRLASPDLDYYRGALKHKPDAHPLELMASHEYAFRLDELLLPAFGSEPSAPIIKYPFLSGHVYPWASSLDPGLCYWHEDGAWWAKRLLRAAAAKLLPADIVMRRRQVFLAPLAHWLLERAWRLRISEEIADSPLWKLDVVRKDVRDGLLQKIARYCSVDTSPRWQEQLWVFLAICAWINRRTANGMKTTT
jgi:asparagine synthetase B (glutamine-hydrolysing)